MAFSLGRWWRGLSTLEKGALLGGTGVGALLVVGATPGRRQPGPSSEPIPIDLPRVGSPVGAAHSMLHRGDVILMPGPFHLRRSPTSTAARGDQEFAGGRVRIMGDRSIANVRRGANETMYSVELFDPLPGVSVTIGYAFIPNMATFA